MKSLIMLAQVVLFDMGTRCATSTTDDFKTVVRRVENEGLSFLTIALSNFGKDFEKSLDRGSVADASFTGFKCRGGLPLFLGGFLRLVFDSGTGRLLDEPSFHAIQAIRQFTLMWAKIDLPCSLRRERAAMARYVECEQDVRQADRRLVSSEPYRLDDFSRIGRLLWANFFSAVDTSIYHQGVVPKHGPGATADKLRGNAKYEQLMWTRRLDSVFPHWEQIIPSESFLQRTDGVTILEPGEEIPVRVITVPKTLKTPRIIAIEPTCMQYMQQGVLAAIVEEMPRHDNTRHFVMFESQEPNQWLAREGSMNRNLATLDLSEASDRVSNQHVRLLIKNHRALREAVDATRSRKADVSGKTIRLAKFASMGSALCFPFEALVFATIVFVGIERVLNRRLTIEDVRSFYGRVRVYGDDIIVPVEYVESVIGELEAFGLRVNSDKSFWTGKFRESCGKDYYDGYDVSIARVRNLLPENRRHVEEIASAVSLRNQFYWNDYDITVAFLDGWIGKIIPFPYVSKESSLLGRQAICIPSQDVRLDPDYQVPLVKGVVIESKLPVSILDDYGALMKWFLMKSKSDKPFEDKDHLQRAGRPVSARIKTRWARP
uniref:RNA-directed RNA polymerase n=1 Tax=Leviviridae sp. TaxID=2027243 RepID=A0A514CZD5_9VIRU|nr:MAG: RNA-dependent RNA polymerase [Leviviridae sp.]